MWIPTGEEQTMTAPVELECPLRWIPAAGAPPVRLRCLFKTGKRRGYIQRVKLAPGRATAVVQVQLPDYQRIVRFYDTTTWQVRWNVTMRPQVPCWNDRDVGTLFLPGNRYVLAERDVLMGDGEKIVWRTTPPRPTDWFIDPLRLYRDDDGWEISSTGDPHVDAREVYVFVHWFRLLRDTPYWDEPDVERRYAVEVFSIEDGTWLRRIEIQREELVPPRFIPETEHRFALDLSKRNRVELVRDGVGLGVLEVVGDRAVVDVDVSYSDRRVLVAMNEAELTFFAIDEVGETG
jgi:hypothetical protein